MSEQSLWSWLHPYLPHGEYSRVETGDTCPGFPDVFYQLPHVSGFLELKHATNPRATVPFKNNNDGLHRSQKTWIKAHLRRGAIVWIVAQIGSDVLFIPGKYASNFNGSPSEYLYAIADLVLTQGKITRTHLKRLKRLLEKS